MTIEEIKNDNLFIISACNCCSEIIKSNLFNLDKKIPLMNLINEFNLTDDLNLIESEIKKIYLYRLHNDKYGRNNLEVN